MTIEQLSCAEVSTGALSAEKSCIFIHLPISGHQLSGDIRMIWGTYQQNSISIMEKTKIDQLIGNAYKGFNDRDIDRVLSLMHSNVHWPKAFEGGYVVGHEAVRAYWSKQWKEIDPVVEPLAITPRPDGKIEVLVLQVVKGMDGRTLFDGKIKHIYELAGDLLLKMDIETSFS